MLMVTLEWVVSRLIAMTDPERDLKIAVASLRKIVRMNPAFFKGGSSNKTFGRKHEQAFEEAQRCALEALQRLENIPHE